MDLRSVLSKFFGAYLIVFGLLFQMPKIDLLILVLLVAVVFASRRKSSERTVKDNASRRERAGYPDF